MEVSEDWMKKAAHAKRLLTIKNPQFLYNQVVGQAKLLNHRLVILTKYHEDLAKIKDFFINGMF